MPHQTFFHLPKEKQEKLMNAAKREFTRVLLGEASINKIIQSIDMPRGSFYLYFENKEDLYFYLLEQNKRSFFERMKEELMGNHGCLMEAYVTMYDYLIKECLKKENYQFCSNVFMNMHLHEQNMISQRRSKIGLFYNHFQELLPYVNQEKLNIQSDNDLIDMMRILMMTMIHMVMGVMMNQNQKEEMRCRYIRNLEMFRHGFYH